MFPCQGGSVVNHVQIAWVLTFLKHLVHEFRLAVLNGPLCQHRHAHQSGGKVALEALCGFLVQCLLHNVHAVGRCGFYQHRIYQVNLCAGGIAVLLLVKECLVDKCIQSLVLLYVGVHITVFSSYLRYLGHGGIAVREETVGHHTNGH